MSGRPALSQRPPAPIPIRVAWNSKGDIGHFAGDFASSEPPASTLTWSVVQLITLTRTASSVRIDTASSEITLG